MSAAFDHYRKKAEECLDRANEARQLEDIDAWLSIAEDWLMLATEIEAAKHQPEPSPATQPTFVP